MVATDPDLDIAALRAPGAARRWLTLAGGGLRLGQQVHAAGFPYYSIAGTSLNLTTGNVSALAGVDDDRRFFTFSAPVQPGNSGGPLIDSRGAVLRAGGGPALGGLHRRGDRQPAAERELRARRGRARTLPAPHGVEPAPGGLGGYDMADGAPADFAEAVVPLLCR